MATSKGFTPAKSRAGAPGTLEEFPSSNGYATALYRGDPISVSTNGYVKRALNTSTVWGVYAGTRYVGDDGKMKFGPYLPANTSSLGGTLIDGVYDSPRVNIITTDGKSFFITADASVTTGLVGRFFEVSYGAGSNLTGQSGFNLKVASASTSTAPTSSMVRLVSLVNGVDNPQYSSTGGGSQNLTAANPIVEVIFLRTRSGTTF